MASAPVNKKTAKTANKVAKIAVFLGPADGSASEFTQSFDLIPIEAMISAGSQPDYAIFEYKTDRFAEIVDATETVTGNRDEISFNRQIYIEYQDPDDDQNNRVLFWGELLTETLHIDPQNQKITIAARVADYHFGDLLEGEYHWDVSMGASVLIPVDPVFNPLIDGVIEGNHLTNQEGNPYFDADLYEMWVDPDATRTQESREMIGNSISPPDGLAIGSLWLLSEAVDVMNQRILDNSEFLYAAALTASDTSGTIWEDQPDVKNLRIPRGRHLNQILDLMLIPHGYNWYIDYEPFDAALGIVPDIVVFRRGEGVKMSAHLQPTGEDLDLSKSNTTHIDVKTDVGNLTNEMRGWGSFEQKELTIELYRGWIESQDSQTAEDLRKSDPASSYNAAEWREAWRLWVANEAGDYTGTRTVTEPIDSYLDLSSVFGAYVPTRRQIEDCLTLDKQGKRRIPYVEWSDDGGTTWYEIPPEWGWVLLPDQIGILFTGDIPPEDMIAAGDDCKVRITGTVTGDERINATSSPILDESPNIRTVPLFLDLSDRYHKRSVQTTGDFASVLADDANGADEADDQTDLQTYLADMLETELSAEMQTAFRLSGIQTQFWISDLIISVEERGIYLNRNRYDIDNLAEKKYPQVYGIRYLFQEQATELIMEAVG